MPYGIIKPTLDRKKHCYNPGIYIDQRKQDCIINQLKMRICVQAVGNY